MKILRKIVINMALVICSVAAAIVFGKMIAKVMIDFKSHSRSGNFSMHVANRPYPITLYGTSTCKYCIAARAYLREAGVGFNDVIIDKSKEAEKQFMLLDENSVPVLVTSSGLVKGFRAREFDELIRGIKN